MPFGKSGKALGTQTRSYHPDPVVELLFHMVINKKL